MHVRALERNPHPFIPARSEARWNTASVLVTYTGEHPALVALEILGYWGHYPSLTGYRLYSMDLPGDGIERAPDTIDAHDYTQTRPFGDAWVREKRSLALAVPSVAAALSRNYLVNPAHPAFGGLTYVDHGAFEYDGRVQNLQATAGHHQGSENNLP